VALAAATPTAAAPVMAPPTNEAPAAVAPDRELVPGALALTALAVAARTGSGTAPVAAGSAAVPLPSTSDHSVFDELAWEPVLKRLGHEWTRAPSGDALTCPQGRVLCASAVIASRHQGGLPSLRLLASVLACRKCSRRSACGQTDSPHFAKTVNVPLTAAQDERLRAVLTATKQRHQQRDAASRPTPNPSPSEPVQRRPSIVRPPDAASPPGPYAPSEARLVPSAFRHVFRQACRAVSVAITVPPHLDLQPARHLGLALTASERQRRRRTWHARLLDNALPVDADVSVLISGPQRALAALGLNPVEPPNLGAAHANI
jgi:hypothetical protein